MDLLPSSEPQRVISFMSLYLYDQGRRELQVSQVAGSIQLGGEARYIIIHSSERLVLPILAAVFLGEEQTTTVIALQIRLLSGNHTGKSSRASDNNTAERCSTHRASPSKNHLKQPVLISHEMQQPAPTIIEQCLVQWYHPHRPDLQWKYGTMIGPTHTSS